MRNLLEWREKVIAKPLSVKQLMLKSLEK